MGYVNVMPSLQVEDLDATVAWYERLIGRAPDRNPMEGCFEWQLADSGGLQIYRNPGAATTATIILGSDDVDAEVDRLRERGIDAETYDVPSGQFRLAQLADPAGNTVILSQVLK